MSKTFKAFLLTAEDGAKPRGSVQDLGEEQLPGGEVLVQVQFSSLNYKDGLALSGAAGIVAAYPMVPGIDLAGTVLASDSRDFQPGDTVLATGYGIGERHWGGYAERARLETGWITAIPDGREPRWAMVMGTAGLTAMLCIMSLEEAGVEPGQGPVAVSGASGGVGSIAVALLAALGYEVAAITARTDLEGMLRELGGREIISRQQASSPPRALEKQRWAGAVDVAGGTILARLLAETRYGGAVAACGLVAGPEFSASVMPFILRGVSLRGVDSVMCPMPRRRRAWQRLAELSTKPMLSVISTGEIGLGALPEYGRKILAGEVQGRVLVNPAR